MFAQKTQTEEEVSKLLLQVKIFKGTQTVKVNMKDIVGGNDDIEKYQEE